MFHKLSRFTPDMDSFIGGESVLKNLSAEKLKIGYRLQVTSSSIIELFLTAKILILNAIFENLALKGIFMIKKSRLIN
jgi:hypothetical protein